MNFKSFMQLCVAFNILMGCHAEMVSNQYDIEEELEERDEETEKEDPEVLTPAPHDEEKMDEGFDACPSDTYVLWEKDGIKYVITIEVFCDPIKNSINLGCPAPF